MQLMRAVQVVVGSFIVCSLAVAQSSSDLNQKITNLIKNDLTEATVGVVVQDLASGKILYDYHGTKHFVPASTTKLFTAAAGLKQLGPDYKYDTSLYYNPAKLLHGIHNDNVAFKFSGDPTFQLANLHSLIKKLQEAQVKEIRGDLIIDDTIFEGPLLGHGWTWDSTSWYHAAPVSAIIIDRNQFGVTLFPTNELGAPVTAKLETIYTGAKFRKLTTNIRGVTFEDSETICQLNAEVDEQNNVNIDGCWPIGTQPTHLRMAVKNPRLMAQRLILEGFEKLHIKFTGKVRFVAVPNNLHRLAHHESASLSVLLNAILGDSNNLYAESLTKTLGAKLFGKGSFRTGAFATQKILSGFTGIDFTQTRIFDGSGESRYNLLTPIHLSRLLYTMHHEQKLAPHFRDALATSGVNGTLQRRFASFDTKANIKAKTGTLKGVSALSGYLTTRSKRELIVTIMINGAVGSTPALKQFENELCYLLVNQL